MCVVQVIYYHSVCQTSKTNVLGLHFEIPSHRGRQTPKGDDTYDEGEQADIEGLLQYKKQNTSSYSPDPPPEWGAKERRKKQVAMSEEN